MQPNETTPILQGNGLSVFFAIICIVDVFGVFPVVALPKPIIDCGEQKILFLSQRVSLSEKNLSVLNH